MPLPKDILRKAKINAVQERTSVLDLLTHILKELASREYGFRTPHRDQLAMLENGIDMGAEGTARRAREELNER